MRLASCLAQEHRVESHKSNYRQGSISRNTLKPLFNNYRYLFLLWAGIISYAQVYVGVHYPIDVFVGAVIGIFFGWVLAYFYSKWERGSLQSL
jgi:undecaprenyl-diphosphatase